MIVSQIFYPGIKVHRIAVLQNGNVTAVPFIEIASPAPLVPRDVRGRRLQVPTTTAKPSPAPLPPQDPKATVSATPNPQMVTPATNSVTQEV